MAAPIPCTALETIKMAEVGANAQASEAAVKMAKPAMKIILAPRRSPNAPPVRMQAANEIVYAVTTHCSSDTPPPSRLAYAVESSVDNGDVELNDPVTQAHGHKGQ